MSFIHDITNNIEKAKSINPNDEYYTPLYAIAPLLKYLEPNSTIWCPFDTKDSNFVKIFTENGHTVVHSHISEGQDFFDTPPPYCDYIISNPPYSLKTDILLNLFNLNKPFAMLVGIVGLFESKKRFSMFSDNTFEVMYLSDRVAYFKNFNDQKPSLSPPFQSVYVCSNILPSQSVFERIYKK